MASSIAYEPFDAPMHDFSEEAEMTNLGPSDNTWFPPHTKMEEDHPHPHIQPETQDIEIVGQYPDGVEVDMTFEETAEYEMADASGTQVPVHGVHELVDAEVFDASAESVIPIPLDPQSQFSAMGFDDHPISFPEVVENQYVQDVSFNSDTVPAVDTQVDSIQQEQSSFVVEPITPLLPEVPNTEPQQPAESLVPPVDLPVAEHLVHEADPYVALPEESSSESRQHSLHPSEAPAEGVTSSDGQILVPTSEVHPEAVEVVEVPEHEPHDEDPPKQNIQPHEDSAEAVHLVHESELANQSEVTRDPGVLQNHVTEAHYVEIPPILLSLHLSSLEGEQPEFALFAPPAPPNEEGAEEALVLLQHRPDLYFEPLSTVFDALRQEQYFSHIEELVESEMILNVYDLQLVIGEDNVYAREVSLHDMVAMHSGLGTAGYLRVALQSFVPRFISRYNLLRDQLAQLISSTNVNEEHPVISEHHADDIQRITESSHQEEPAEPADLHDTEESKPAQDVSTSRYEQSYSAVDNGTIGEREEAKELGHNEEADLLTPANEAQDSADTAGNDFSYETALQESSDNSEDHDDGADVDQHALAEESEQAETFEGGELLEEKDDEEDANEFTQELDEEAGEVSNDSALAKDDSEHEQSQHSAAQDEHEDSEEPDDDEFSPLPSEDGDIPEEAEDQDSEKDLGFIDGTANNASDVHESTHSVDDRGDAVSANSGTSSSTLDTEHSTHNELDDAENDQFPDSKLGSDDDAYGEYYEEEEDDTENHVQQASSETEENSHTHFDQKAIKLRKRSHEDLEEVLENPSTYEQKKARTS